MKVSMSGYAPLVFVFASRMFGSACPVAPTPLSTYIGFGAGGCTISGETVDNFAFLVGSTSAGLSPLTASAIMVTPGTITDGYQVTFSATGNTTSTGFMVTGAEFANYEIDFTWDPVVVGAEDQMNANSPTFPGTASVNTNICAGSACPPTTNTLMVFDDGRPADNILSAVTYFSPVSIVGTQSFISLNANGATSEITGFSNAVFAPEPSVITLTTAGLFGLAMRLLVRRRQPTV